jgi:hypothetical protein
MTSDTVSPNIAPVMAVIPKLPSPGIFGPGAEIAMSRSTGSAAKRSGRPYQELQRWSLRRQQRPNWHFDDAT